jgi:Ion channel
MRAMIVDEGRARREHPARRLESFRHFGYALVLALIAVSYAFCAAQASPDPSTIALLIQLVTVAVILWVAEVGPTLRRIGWIVLTVAGVGVATVQLLGTQGAFLDILLSGASAVAYLIAPVAIILHQARKPSVDVQTLVAATASYILVGMFYAFVYNFIALVSAVPIFGAEEADSLTNQLFFSFTTLTTVGYGNVVPVSAFVQGIAIAEAISGQLFLVIAVARVVSGWKPPTIR